jgi:hypothetical protein
VGAPFVPDSTTKSQGAAVAVHPEREHGATGDLKRHPLHRFAQIDRRVAGGFHPCDRLVGSGHHVWHQRRDCTRRRPAQGPAPMLQALSASTGLPSMDAARRPAGARIVFVVVDQHMPDRIRRVEDEAAAPEETPLTISSS